MTLTLLAILVLGLMCGNELSVGNTAISFGSGVQLTLNLQNEPALVAGFTPFVLVAGTGTTTISGTGTPIAAFGQSLNVNATNFYRERQIQIGLRMRF